MISTTVNTKKLFNSKFFKPNSSDMYDIESKKRIFKEKVLTKSNKSSYSS